ncbi:hypothetical protein HMPREF3151_11345 [Corynebacterium sp. HMSC05H05]|uniref:hypothetical protein n=1 Tax=Corynebacterium sp. HMSC05H05 TaxID=1581119 RepID=UPI0008A25D26|nr:hypothetical protein [Corynebacterium sp. HMSC05H05]OFT55628.1 hypothetical protein HMPREF3151_11345 [Corynebacterium sp. HMSC05H05]
MSGFSREDALFFDIAHEGAQLRAVGQAAHLLAGLRGLEPRSVVVLATDQVAAAAARAVAAFAAPLEVPVVVADELPAYVGALDVVVVLGDNAGREEDLRGLITAANRGAETILAGPKQGPLLDDAPQATTVIPALPDTAGASPLRACAVVGAVLAALRQPTEVVAERFELLAAEVDAELESVSPRRDVAVNAARKLRAQADGKRVLHTGFGRAGSAVAELAAALWSTHGIPASAVGAEELPFAVERAQEGNSTAGADDLFHDPYIDGPAKLVGLTTVVWSCGTASPVVSAGSRVESVETDVDDPAARAARLVARAYAATALAADAADAAASEE